MLIITYIGQALKLIPCEAYVRPEQAAQCLRCLLGEPPYCALCSARQLSSMRLEKPHSLSYQAKTFSNLPLTLV